MILACRGEPLGQRLDLGSRPMNASQASILNNQCHETRHFRLCTEAFGQSPNCLNQPDRPGAYFSLQVGPTHNPRRLFAFVAFTPIIGQVIPAGIFPRFVGLPIHAAGSLTRIFKPAALHGIESNLR